MDETSDQARTETRTFPIVGIGASAGGLEALTELLSKMPADSGMALLIVQHLDPNRPSMLVDILSRATPMRIEEAADGTLIEVNHVYVISPNTSMSVAQGHLMVKPRGESMGPPMPADDLLESLAKDQGANAIGVILSGSGTDGAIGIQAIKGCGGVTFAQDDATARFSSMPRAAIGLGSVDFVLSPPAIADQLVRVVARHPYLGAEGLDTGGENRQQSEGELGRLFRQLRTACNIDFSHYKRGTVERRLARRLALHALDTVPAYLEILENDPAEAHALCRDLLIRYTEFFRDSNAFVALSDTVFPRLLQHGDPAVPLRIWVPGCATGEEVYSIAICLAEYMASRSLNNPVQIFGTDISEEALETARSARYIENIARNVSAERLARFFVKEGDHYRVSKPIRDMVTFARQNVAYDPPFSRIDLVSCRNLLIYLDPTLQKRVMPAFHFALQRDGVLMLGLSETVGAYSELFSVIESKRAKLFGKKPVSHRAYVGLNMAMPALAAASVQAARAPAGAPQPDDRDLLRRESDQAALARYAPPSVVCDDAFNVVEFRGDTGAFLSNPPGAPTNQLQRLARPDLFLAIREALRRTRSDGVAVRKAGLHVEVAGQVREVIVDVVPLRPSKTEGRWFLVFFSLVERAAPEAGGKSPSTFGQALKAALMTRLAGRAAAQGEEAKDKEIARLSAELEATREQTRVMLEDHESAMEELKALEEETQSSNEEFQSTNEELETAKEELQSVNEELSTTNDELRFRNRELKSLQDVTQQARDYADAIIETTSEPMLVLDEKLRVTRANQAFYDAFKTSPQETLLVSLYSLGAGQWNIPGLRELLEELMPGRAFIRDYEVTAEFPRIGRRTMRLNAARIVWPNQALILLTIDDTTARRALETLTEAGRQKDEFLAMLGHELRNPLAAMSNAMHMWKHANADEEVKDRALATMERQLRNQVRMVDDLLDLSRITRGLIVLRRERCDLGQIIRQAHDALREQIAARRHEVTMAVPLGGVLVDGDPARLEQVMTNLLSNAVKCTPPGGRIEVALHREGMEAILTVTDNGIGMTEQFLTEVFTVFVQAERSVDRNMGGLGIGLALVRRLVEMHGGTIQARSSGLGQGSRFVVRLPALPADTQLDDREAVGERPPDDLTLSGVPRRVLVVDDNPDAGESTAALLSLEGHEVRLAHDGPSALSLARDFRPDAVLLDIGLPGIDGYEVCRQLRRLPQHQHTLIIAISGFGRHQDVDRARDAGFDHHLTKPADPLWIAELLRNGK